MEQWRPATADEALERLLTNVRAVLTAGREHRRHPTISIVETELLDCLRGTLDEFNEAKQREPRW